ncbi:MULTISPECIES: hypothetical protein [unclassified Caballeronia]|uniref:hypothetical protein n=1 Tax=unclassified Caballeronia TaxID=2646786 RepID=UPI0028658C96|nr:MULTISPECIES: hypothetical protein [unclassified Caballeronia]MDR5777267.1 hypothetical protein [Caballeronia sp. LZ002]MDR5852705.1 hypothetical protein [Caballeronia sp. LZ003]
MMLCNIEWGRHAIAVVVNSRVFVGVFPRAVNVGYEDSAFHILHLANGASLRDIFACKDLKFTGGENEVSEYLLEFVSQARQTVGSIHVPSTHPRFVSTIARGGWHITSG